MGYSVCTRNDDNLNLFIKSGNTYKKSVISQTIVCIFKKCKGRGTQLKVMVVPRWRQFSQIQKQAT